VTEVTLLSQRAITFERSGYSYYDNSFVYEFRSDLDGQIKSWWLHEKQAVAVWKEYFAAIG
jgi:hypothetical protein